jgi:quercetin dioxygenase-like cupin family protein
MDRIDAMKVFIATLDKGSLVEAGWPVARGSHIGHVCNLPLNHRDRREPLMTTSQLLAATVLIVASALAPHIALAQQPDVKRTDLQRHDLSVSGREAIQVHVELAPGVAFPRHSHPGEEIIYVLTGSLEYEVEGKPPVTLEAGDVLYIPAGTVHSAKNVGSDNGAELATYIVEKGKPLVVLAE